MLVEPTSVMASIRDTVDYFDVVVSTIPVWYYYPRLEDNDPEQGKKTKQTKSVKKEKFKKKFDPSPVDILSVQQDKEKEKQEKEETINKASKKQKKAPKAPEGNGIFGATKGAGSMDDLRARLQQRMADLKTNRQTSTRGPNKRKKPEASVKGADKADKKAKAKKQQKTSGNKNKAGDAPAKKTPVAKPALPTTTTTKPTPAPAAAAAVEKPMDFAFSSVVAPKDLTKKHLERGPSDKKVLAKVRAFDARVDAVSQKNPELAKAMVKNKEMDNAVLRASGIKVRDNEARIKKAIKKKEKSKQKSQKEWKDRTKVVNQGKADRLKKRHENISDRMVMRKENRVKASIKKRGDARNVPGA